MIKTPGNRGLGLRISLPDIRDYHYTPRLGVAAPLPPKTNNRAKMPPVRNQSSQGSCTAFSTTTAAWFTYMFEGYHGAFAPAPAFQYYNSRRLEGSDAYDSGSTIADAMRALAAFGMCGEHFMPYNPSDWTTPPSNDAYTNAVKHQAVNYYRIDQTVDAIKACLAEHRCVNLGVAVYASFESATALATGQIPMPQPSEQLLGWHAQCVCDYDDAAIASDGLPGVFTAQNSWGPNLMDSGYTHFSYRYLTNPQLCSDLWILKSQH